MIEFIDVIIIIVLDRDYNASLNILKRGLIYLPLEQREVTLVGSMPPTTYLILRRVVIGGYYPPMKQEAYGFSLVR